MSMVMMMLVIYLHETIRLQAHAQSGTAATGKSPIQKPAQRSNQQKCTPAFSPVQLYLCNKYFQNLKKKMYKNSFRGDAFLAKKLKKSQSVGPFLLGGGVAPNFAQKEHREGVKKCEIYVQAGRKSPQQTSLFCIHRKSE